EGERSDWRKCTPKARQPSPAREQPCEEYAAPSTAAPTVARRSGPTLPAAWRGAHRTNSQRASEPRETYGAVSQSRLRSKPLPRQSRSWLGVADCAVQKKSSRVLSRLSNVARTPRARRRGACCRVQAP